MKMKKSKVSILIPNYNHSMYLDQCLQSALDQTYENREIILLDNSSTDNSLEVAMKYREQGVRICRNQMNIANKSFSVLFDQLCDGDYFMLLCADDFLLPTFVSKAVAVMEDHPNVGYVHGERDFITEKGRLIPLDPFYQTSFVAPGENFLPIYMVTTVAHPSQALIRTSAMRRIGGYDMEIDHLNADRSLWFYLSLSYDGAYLREKLCRIRIAEGTETVITQRNFQHPILYYLTLKDYLKVAKRKGLDSVLKREAEAFQRLAGEFITYGEGMMLEGDLKTAKAYLDFSYLVSRRIVENERYHRLQEMIDEETANHTYIDERTRDSFRKKRNYSPPQGYEEIVIREA